MAYSDDISDLGADHHWKFDGGSTDTLGSVVATDSTMSYAGIAIAEDASNSAVMDTRADQISLASTTTINNGTHARKAVAGWFMVSAKELPTCTIYSEGDATTNFMMLIFPGNSVMLQARDGSTWQAQVYSGISLEGNRVYHLCGIFEGSGYSTELRFYIDGVEQTSFDVTGTIDAALSARTGTYFGDAASTGPNGVALVMDSPGDDNAGGEGQTITAYYQHWCAWGDEADAVLTETEVRETLFERGALADITLSGTLSTIQSALTNTYNDTVRGDAPVCIEIEDPTDVTDFTLTLDNTTFNSLASCHIRYNGTGDTCTVINTNGADCSIVSAPFGGSIEVFTEVEVKITVKSASDLTVITGAMVLLEADTGGDLTEGTDIIKTTTTAGIVSDDFNYSSDQPITGVVRKGTSSTYYQSASFTGTITADGLDITVLLVEDE